ncbi:monovalent cation/H+ antiporter subunit A [Demequina activiva]|uniref:Monovalent cation/H+ antiporter subunit A n=1 Tax=Demequina activiva TaxID=1582364 RepID=A0A919Q4D9_9MICO|nr:monovalent cation/H+ antiporter subunit A [Demequina activiva]
MAGALLAVAAIIASASSGGVREETLAWMPTLGVELSLRLDGLSLVFALLVLVIGAVVLAYSAGYLPHGRHSSFYGLMTLFAAAMLLLVLADDVVVLFVAWEATTLCSFFLIARSGAGGREPAIRTLLVTVLGGLALLSAAVVMAVGVGSTRISTILADGIWAEDAAFTATVAALLGIAAFTKSAQFPFQAWLPDSMVAITPVSAYLHAAAMVKAGIYLLFRFSPALAGVPLWSSLLVTAGLITAALGSIAALKRHDLKELLAYSTISQLGFLVAMIGVGTPEALAAAIVHTIAHALFKSSLFLAVGVIDHTVGTRDIRKLGGVGARMPVTATITILAAASMAGIPPLLGFVSKESLLDAFWEAPGAAWLGPMLAILIAVFAVFTFAYCARLVIGAFSSTADHPDSATPLQEASPLLWLPVALPAVAGLVLGLVPGALDGLVSGAATAASGTTVDKHLSLWHGVTPALILSVLVITAGVLMAVGRRRVDAVLQPLHWPWSGLAVVDSVRAGTERLGAWVGGLTATTSPRRHLLIPILCLLGLALAAGMGGLDLAERVTGPSTALDWGLLVLVLAGVAGAVASRTRITAVVVIGVVGFAITAWFYSLGAADVAMTQLLVEILTVVVMVLLLRRLPRTFAKQTRRGAIVPALIAVGAGIATTAAVMALTGRRSLSNAGDYYVREGESETGGANIVNTILVDFRALDTLGELTVLGIAGLTIVILLRVRRELDDRQPEPPIDRSQALADALANSVFTRTLTRLVGPLTVLLSVILLLRGHQEPGGGFIAALMGGAGFALLYLAAPTDDVARLRQPFLVLIGAGVLVATVTGLLGYLNGSFLATLHLYVGSLHLTSALLFDIGVYLAVIGVVLAAMNLLGLPRTPRPPLAEDATPAPAQPTEEEVARS